jgi:hypothetical protein
MRLKRWNATLGGVAVALLGAFVLPGTAAASNTAYVAAGVAASAPYNSCAHPGYSSIQEALAGSDATIRVCDNAVYHEQLAIERPVTIDGGGAEIALPSTPAKSETTCDAASEAGDHLEDQDLISICTSGKVKISGLEVDAIWSGEPIGSPESCAYNLYGIFVGGGANLALSTTTVKGAAPTPINGCQYGVGVQVGAAYASPVQTATATIKQDNVEDYQKNGITIEGSGSTAKIESVTVTGAGPTTVIAQNGIGVQEGASADISAVSATDNECENATCGSNLLTQYGAEGVYFYGAAAGSKLTNSYLTDNDIGVETFDLGESAPTKAPVTLNADKFVDDRYAGALLNQGLTKVNNSEFTGGDVGIELLQYEGQTFGAFGTANDDTVSKASDWAVEGLSDLAAGDEAGGIKVSNSALSGNPGATAAESVYTNNPTGLPIKLRNDT